MLKNILAEKNITTYRFAKDIMEPYSTINDLVNGKVDIEDCKVKILRKISSYLEMSMEDIVKLCSLKTEIFSSDYAVYGSVTVEHKKYYLRFSYDNVLYEKEICKVTELSSIYIMEVSKYEMEKILAKKRMEKYLCSMS